MVTSCDIIGFRFNLRRKFYVHTLAILCGWCLKFFFLITKYDEDCIQMKSIRTSVPMAAKQKEIFHLLNSKIMNRFERYTLDVRRFIRHFPPPLLPHCVVVALHFGIETFPFDLSRRQMWKIFHSKSHEIWDDKLQLVFVNRFETVVSLNLHFQCETESHLLRIQIYKMLLHFTYSKPLQCQCRYANV